MKKIKWIVGLLLVAAMVVGCTVFSSPTEPTTLFEPDLEHALQEYTQWIGLPVNRAINGLNLTDVKAEGGERIPTKQCVCFVGTEFDLELLTLKDFDNCFSGIELTTQFDGGAEETAAAVWEIIAGIDAEYTTDDVFQQNILLENMEVLWYDYLIDENTFYRSLDRALNIHGLYSVSVSWDITRLASKQTKELLESMKPSVLAEVEEQYKGKNYAWCADDRLEIQLHANIYEDGKADVTVICQAAVDPAATMDAELEPKDRQEKFKKDAFDGFASQKYLHVTGYEFNTCENEVTTLYEDIYLCGEDYVSVIDNGVMQTALLCVDGKQYTAVYENGVYGKWEPVSQSKEHPLSWTRITDEMLRSTAAGTFGTRGGKHVGSIDFHQDDRITEFYLKNNTVSRAVRRTTEKVFMGYDNLISEVREVLEFEIITEEEAAAVLNEYKAKLS